MNEWKSLISKLVLIAESQPQLAYSAFTRSLQSQWTYFQRVTPNCGTFFDPLEDIITRQLLPTLFGCELSTNERTLLSLPTRMSGLNILNPVVTAQLNYTTSRRLTNPIVEALTLNTDLDFDEFHHHYYTVHQEVTKERDISAENTFGDCFSGLSTAQQRAVSRAKDEKISFWLNVIPTSKHHFDLSAQEFRDALALRYKKPLLCVPSICDGCGASFDLSHALICRKGGLVTQRHNEIRDALGDLSSLAWSQVKKEPIVKEADESSRSPALVADLSVRGVWVPQAEALFDVRVVDTDAQSYLDRSPLDVLSIAESEKKRKYHQACLDRRALFTPLCISVDGLLGRETNVFIKRLADRLSLNWKHSYPHVLGWVRTRLTFSILRATLLCLRGSRKKWHTIDVTDGTPLSLIMS